MPPLTVIPKSPAPIGPRECAACLEEIPATARKCPHCGTVPGLAGHVARFLLLAGGILTVISLVIAVRQVVGRVGSAIELQADTQTRLSAAKRLVETRDYESAWQMIESIQDAGSAPVREAQFAIARAWLLDAGAEQGRSTFRDITDRVTPALASFHRGSDRARAEAHALLGFAQFLRGRVERVHGDPVTAYREALEIDSDCALAHLFLGNFLVAWTSEPEAGYEHLDRAVQLERAGRLPDVSARRWQLRALFDCARSYKPRAGDSAAVAPAARLVRALDEMRRGDETLPADRDEIGSGGLLGDIVMRVYRQAMPTDPKDASILREVLAPEAHAATLAWLDQQNPKKEPDAWLLTWKAYFEEQVGDKHAALSTYARIPEPPSRVAAAWDAASVRLSGQPHRPLASRDPWAHAVQVLRAGDRESAEYKKALDGLNQYMRRHRWGFRNEDLQALKAAQAAGASLHVGRLLVATERPGDAIPILTKYVERSESDRGDALVTLAVAYAQRSATQEAKSGDIDRAIERLAEAVESAGYANWARIRWFEDLAPVHAHPEYAKLLARHRRTVGGSFRGGGADGR